VDGWKGGWINKLAGAELGNFPWHGQRWKKSKHSLGTVYPVDFFLYRINNFFVHIEEKNQYLCI
jgi:hypothetical protein